MQEELNIFNGSDNQPLINGNKCEIHTTIFLKWKVPESATNYNPTQ